MVTYFIAKPGQFDFALQVAAPMILLEQEQASLRAFLFSAIPFVLLVDGDSGEILATVRDLRGPGLSAFIGKQLEKKGLVTAGQ